MLNIVFWNVGRDPGASAALIGRLMSQERAIVGVFAEASDRAEEVRAACELALSRKVAIANLAPVSPWRPTVLTSAPTLMYRTLREDSRAVFVELRLPPTPPFLLVAVHLRSQLHARAADKHLEANELREAIESVEAQRACNRTMLIGDFNLDPFDAPLVDANGLHAVFHRGVASRRSRNVQGKDRRFFVNCSWSKYRTEPQDAGGSYYYEGGAECRHWHMFDQVMIRPELMADVPTTSIDFITSIGDRSLLRNRWQIDSTVSDHLPLRVRV